MGDVGEVFKAMKGMSRDKRASNRRNGESELFTRRIPFLKKNGGAHLIVNHEDPKSRCDYWPGTGLWRSYWGSKEGRGVKSLLEFLGVE